MDFDPTEVKSLLPYIVVVELVGEPVRYRVRLYGTAIAALRGDDLTGRYLDEPGALPPGLWPQFKATYDEATTAREPVVRDVTYRRLSDQTREWQHCRVILPFARGDATDVAIPDGRDHSGRRDRRAARGGSRELSGGNPTAGQGCDDATS